MDDATFLRAFEDRTLSHEGFDHRGHVRAAFLLLIGNEFEEALTKMRAGLRALLEAHGLEGKATVGYHETLTRGWLTLVAGCVDRRGPAVDSEAFLADHAELLRKNLLLTHYSRDRLMSAEAKAAFIEPDREPWPVVEDAGGTRSGCSC